jgi:hypothetical protein
MMFLHSTSYVAFGPETRPKNPPTSLKLEKLFNLKRPTTTVLNKELKSLIS